MRSQPRRAFCAGAFLIGFSRGIPCSAYTPKYPIPAAPALCVMAADTAKEECDKRTGDYRENEAGEDRDPLHQNPRVRIQGDRSRRSPASGWECDGRVAPSTPGHHETVAVLSFRSSSRFNITAVAGSVNTTSGWRTTWQYTYHNPREAAQRDAMRDQVTRCNTQVVHQRSSKGATLEAVQLSFY
jgi:hypothetical protein